MPSREDRVVTASALVTLAGLAVVTLVASTVGFPGEWGVVVGFVFFLGAGYVLPQAYLMRVDDSVGHTSRMGVISLMAVFLALGFADHVTGPEQGVIWGTVGITVVGMFGYEALSGYRTSMESTLGDESR